MIEHITKLEKEKDDLYQRYLTLNKAIDSLKIVRPDLNNLISELESDAELSYEKMQLNHKFINAYQHEKCSHVSMEKVDSNPHGDVYECPDCGFSETY